jgi:hypothetical protein
MEELKYYTPEIKEFHVGFEYEYNNNHVWMHEPTKGEWKKEEYINGVGRDGESDYQEIMNMLDNDEVRVKHLNKEDIASLGWGDYVEPREYNHSWSIGSFIIYVWFNALSEDGVTVRIYDSFPHHVFQGNIKNKSELKKLMGQLNIKTKEV